MENEEKEDLLLELTESEEELYEKEEIDYYIEQKILDLIQNETPNTKSNKNTLIFIATCSLMFLSSSILIISLPIYVNNSSANNITTYSKLVTLSFVNAVFFIIAHVVGVLSKCGIQTSPNLQSLRIRDVLKISFIFSIGSISCFWLIDGNYVSCHLEDPLKGCSIVFSLLFYFVFSRKKMSLERTFCAITIIVGVFVSVDFGICDKFRCNGNSNLTETAPKLHFLYVILYLLAHGIWVLNFTFVEVFWTNFKGSNSNLSVSILSNVTRDSNISGNTNNPTGENMKPSVQSLSIICQEGEPEVGLRKENLPELMKTPKKSFFKSFCRNNSLSKSVPIRNQLSVPDFNKFPLTSTPNHKIPEDGWQSLIRGHCCDLALWQHITCCLVVLGLCWVPTVSFTNGTKPKLLVEVMTEVFDSFTCHIGWNSNSTCSHLPTVTIIVSVSYVALMLSSIELLKIAQSAVTVVSIMMAALPISSLFWSLFRLNKTSIEILEFNPEITGEAVCAVLGLPIIGIGIVLLLKSHIREFNLVM